MVYSNVDFITFVSLGMLCTLFVQLHQLRSKQIRKIFIAQDAFMCSLLTACVCVPLFEYFPDLPYALCLPIGGAIGTIGFTGWQKFVSSLFDSVLDRILGMIEHGSPRISRRTKEDKNNDIQSK